VSRDWLAWHDEYDTPGSRLHQRLLVVQQRVRDALAVAAPGPINVISMCAGQGRDLLDVLRDHPRRGDVRARLVEFDPRNVARAKTDGLTGIDVVHGDASITTAYEGAVPAQVVMACGVFGNVPDEDIRNTIEHLPSLCAAGATVIWTRHPRDDEILPMIDAWFVASGFRRLGLDQTSGFGVGVHQLVALPPPYRRDVRLFTFVS
jgi:hypothetical protein